MTTHHRSAHRLRMISSRLAPAATSVLALPLAHAGPPVQYERVSFIGQTIGGQVVDREGFYLGDHGRLFATVEPDYVPGIGHGYGLYVRDDGVWREVLPSRRYDTGDEWGAIGRPLILDDRVAVVAKRGLDTPEYSVRELMETPEGDWIETEVILRTASKWMHSLHRIGSAYRWTESATPGCCTSNDHVIYQAEGGEPVPLLRMDDVVAQIDSYYGTVVGSFVDTDNQERVLVYISDRNVAFGEASLYLWPLDETEPPDFLAGHDTGDQAPNGRFEAAINQAGGLLLLRERSTGKIQWTPLGASLTPGFDVATGPGEGFRSIQGVSYAAVPSINEAGRVLFHAVRADGVAGLFIGPDPESDSIWLEGDSLLGKIPSMVFVSNLSERDQFIARMQLQDEPWWYAVATICPADVNRDGIIDNGDIGAWVTLYLDGSLRADFNNDGVVDNGDIGEFITQFHDGC
ncbi:MAG: hypothetical protein ACI89L_000697 [Phycisphaerales bacterium]|jgi:hypothetical protein